VQLILEQWPKEPVSYRYILHTEDGKTTEEWGNEPGVGAARRGYRGSAGSGYLELDGGI